MNVSIVFFDFTSKGLCIINDPDLLKFFLNLLLPDVTVNNTFDLGLTHDQQKICTELATKAAKHPDSYCNRTLDGCVILCYVCSNEDCHKQWKIASIKEMVVSLIKWHHSILAHPRHKQSRIRRHVDKFNCDYCQHVKTLCKGIGLLPECDTNTMWYKVGWPHWTMIWKKWKLNW